MATATKPAVKKPIPIAPSKSRAVMPWDEQMANVAKKQAAVEKPMGMFKSVNIMGGVMMIDDKKVPDNELLAVVLAATHENQWYSKPYNPGTPTVPDCYAFGDQSLEDPEAHMTAPADVDNRQGEEERVEDGSGSGVCANCWANKMGSADTGKGKACKNIRRMIITTADAIESADTLLEAEVRSFKIPVMSVRNWVSFVHEMEETYQRPYYGVVVKIKVVPDQKAQWLVQFHFEELINFDSELWSAMQKRVNTAAKEIMSPYPKLEEQPAPTTKGRGVPAKSTGKAPTGPAAKRAGKY